MLTPKMSLRRNNVLKAYLELIEKAYKGEVGAALPRIAKGDQDE